METLRVIINTRPLLPDEAAHHSESCVTLISSPPAVTLRKPKSAATFRNFDSVYDAATAASLYDEQVSPLVQSLFDGFNATVFAYGQTAAGKSYTMSGVTTNAARQIFSLARGARAQGRVVTVRVGFVEIYKEVIRDLVDGARGPLGAVTVNVRERMTKAGKVVFLDGARERCVGDEEELLSIIREGALVRRTAATGMNASSSRSHSVITITVQQEAPDGCLAGKLHLVDLAGSERAKRTHATGARFAEGVDINRGLFALAKVISSLAANSQGEKRHVPYRDSKLTRLLQDSLGGNARTLLVACISPADSSREETMGTLRYAERAKSIKNNPKKNTEPDAVEISDLRAALARAKAEIARLAAENESLRRGHTSVSYSPERELVPLRKTDPLIVTRDNVVVTGLKFRIKQLEGMLAEQKNDGACEVGLATFASTNIADVRRRERNPKRRTRPPNRVPQPKIGGRSTSTSVLPTVHQRDVERRKASPSRSSDSSENSECMDEYDGQVMNVVSATRMDAMRTTFTERLRQAENDKQSIDAERVKLLRQITASEQKHRREVEDLKSAHWQQMHDLRAKVSENKRDGEYSRLLRAKEASDASHRKIIDRVSSLEKAREDIVARLAESVLREEQIRRRMGKENRELAKSEKTLRGELRRLVLVRGRLEAAVKRLKIENDGLKNRLSNGVRVVRRANSALVRPVAR